MPTHPTAPVAAQAAPASGVLPAPVAHQAPAVPPTAPALPVPSVPLKQVIAEKMTLVAEVSKTMKQGQELLTSSQDALGKVTQTDELNALDASTVLECLKLGLEEFEKDFVALKASTAASWPESKASAEAMLLSLQTKIADVSAISEELMRTATEQKAEEGKTKQKDKNRFQTLQRELRGSPVGKTLSFVMAKLIQAHEKDPELPCESTSSATEGPTTDKHEVTRFSLDHQTLKGLLEFLKEKENADALDQKVDSLVKHLLKSKDPGACAPCPKLDMQSVLPSLEALGEDVPVEPVLTCPWVLAIGKKAVRFGAACIPFCGLGGLVVGHSKMGPSFYIIAVQVSTLLEQDAKGLGAIIERLDKDWAITKYGKLHLAVSCSISVLPTLWLACVAHVCNCCCGDVQITTSKTATPTLCPVTEMPGILSEGAHRGIPGSAPGI